MFWCDNVIIGENIMGRWSFAPMGSDDALDAKIVFFDYVAGLKGVDKYFLDDETEKARLIFNGLTLEEIDDFLEDEPIFGYNFVIPYVYLEYKAFDASIEIKEKLKSLLKEAIFDFCNPYYGECQSDTDYNTYENLLDFNIPQDSNFYHLYCLQVFLNSFEDIFSGKIEFEDQSGLIDTFLNSKGRNAEEHTPEENEFGDIPMYVDGWGESMHSFISGIEDKEIAMSILLKMARRGDIWAQRHIIEEYHEAVGVEVCFEILYQYLIYLNTNDLDELSLDFECECIYSYEWNDDGLLYKNRLSEIYSYIRNNNKSELMVKFYQVYFAYQELGNKYLKKVAIPDYYLKKDIALVESYLSMDFYGIGGDLCSAYPNDNFSSIKPKKIVIPETYRGYNVAVVEFIEYIEENCELMVIGSNVRSLTGEGIWEEDKEKITSDLACVDIYGFRQHTMSCQINPDNPYLTIQNDTFYSKDLSILYRYVGSNTNIFTIPDTVTKIADYALACEYFSEIVFGPNVKEFGTYSLDVNGAENLTIRFNGSIEQLMYYKEMFQGDAIDIGDMEDEDLENIYIICQDGEIKLFDFLYNM